jgi:hypothetical protein
VRTVGVNPSSRYPRFLLSRGYGLGVRRGKRMPDSTWTAIAAIATGVAAVATVVLAFATVYLGAETRRLAVETNESLRTERQAESNRRAEVHVSNAQFLKLTVSGYLKPESTIRFKVEGSGEDPSTGVRVTMRQPPLPDQTRHLDVVWPDVGAYVVGQGGQEWLTVATGERRDTNPTVEVLSFGLLGQSVTQLFEVDMVSVPPGTNPILQLLRATIQPNVPGAAAIILAASPDDPPRGP